MSLHLQRNRTMISYESGGDNLVPRSLRPQEIWLGTRLGWSVSVLEMGLMSSSLMFVIESEPEKRFSYWQRKFVLPVKFFMIWDALVWWHQTPYKSDLNWAKMTVKMPLPFSLHSRDTRQSLVSIQTLNNFNFELLVLQRQITSGWCRSSLL